MQKVIVFALSVLVAAILIYPYLGWNGDKGYEQGAPDVRHTYSEKPANKIKAAPTKPTSDKNKLSDIEDLLLKE